MEYYLGLDVGTSSLKAILANGCGVIYRAKREYPERTISSINEAVCSLLSELVCKNKDKKIAGVAFSSQVGTYITDGGELIGWWESVGKEELSRIRERFSDSEIFSEISMHHPDIISYPLPRFLYIKERFPNTKKVMMPKEYFLERLTGNFVSDPYSYRGLYNFERGELSSGLLSKLGIDFKLPEIRKTTEIAGYVTDRASREYSLPEGTPVYVGMNDFFSGLIGMGVSREGDSFDISGTSEHVGYISRDIVSPPAVSGNYINGFASYGGTKSSGASCDFAIKNFGADGLCEDIPTDKNPPIFLPYLCGERAPIYDENARGVFFGIDGECDRDLLAYSVLEGVVFSLYDIADRLGMSGGGALICGGGSSKNRLMAKIKAALFGKDILLSRESDTSALGAAMTAMVGGGVFSDFNATGTLVDYEKIAEPDGRLREWLLPRFYAYRSLYSALKNEFVRFNSLKEMEK